MKRKNVMRLIVCGVVAGAMAAMLALSGCGGSQTSSSNGSSNSSNGGQQVELQIFAANSLEKALPEVQELYTKSHSNVTFKDTQFKASGDLVQQLTADNSAADVLITASTKTMDKAADLISSDTRKDMFTNDLVVTTKKDSDIKITSLEDLKNVKGTIAIGEPNTVPAGKYAIQALKSAGEDADGKITNIQPQGITLDYGSDKVGTVANHIATGDFAAGLVYSSDIYRYDGIQSAYVTPSDSHKEIKYPGAVVKTSSNADVAADFLNFCMTDADAQKIFSNYGFELAG